MNERSATRRWPVIHLLSAFGIVCSLASAVAVAEAAPATRQKPKASARLEKPAKAAARSKAPQAPAAAPAAAPGATAPASGAAPGTPGVAGTPSTSSTKPAAAVVKTEEREGEKTYTFGAQEVEGRLKSPQILYFLRRVRAEFDPAPLGHRSFLLELSDTRRHPAFE